MKNRFKKSEHDTTNKVKKVFKKNKGWFGKKVQKSSVKSFDMSTVVNMGDVVIKKFKEWQKN